MMKVSFFKSLRVRMPLLVLSGIIPLISVAIFLASERASKTIVQESQENLELKAELLAQSIERWEKSNVLALLNLNKQPDMIAGNIEKQEIILSEIVNTYKHLSQAIVIDRDGWSIADNSKEQNSKYYGDKEYFQSALNGNNINYETLINSNDEQPNLCLSSPLKNGTEIAAVTAICTDLNILTQQVGQLEFGETGYAFVVDRHGYILVHPKIQYLSKSELTNFSTYPPVKRLLKNGEEETTISFKDNRGVEWISHGIINQNGWGVFVLQEKQEFLKSKIAFENLAYLIAFITIAGTTILTICLANRLIKPVTQLSNAALTIASGQLDRHVNIKREDELGILSSSFNQMATQLKTSFDQLKRAKDDAVSANLAKDRFIANISHELRTPLNSIIGYTKVLKREFNYNSERIEELNIIEKSGYYLLNLINDILDFSKNQANKTELDPINFNLRDLLNGVVGIVENQAREKGVEIIVKSEYLPDRIIGDEKRLQQVLINLLSNAIKFTDRGRVMLRATGIYDREIAKDLSQQKIRFEIIDTGVGISQKEKAKIFEPFEQAKEGRSANIGTGLGLSIAKQLVDLMGGKLQVKSILGKGSNFWFEAEFPLGINPVNLDRSKLNISNILGYKGQQRTILVVDDKKANRWLLVNILEPLGFKIITAENGENMFTVMEIERPDLICLDLFMPEKTGFTSAKQLRSSRKYRDIPVIIISATAISEEIRQFLECDVFLSKPVDEAELLRSIQQYLNLQWIYKPHSVAEVISSWGQ
ncbi:MAG: ATP-binding protein [Prochloraceae cyanobacterium]